MSEWQRSAGLLGRRGGEDVRARATGLFECAAGWMALARGVGDNAPVGPDTHLLVSSTVRDLVAGSGITFSERGVHELKGLPGQWQLFAASPQR
jgi:hypothetical protein